MEKLSFEAVYEKLQKKLNYDKENQQTKEEKLFDAILNSDDDYINDKEKCKKEFNNYSVKIKEKQYGQVTYGAYMYKIPCLKNSKFDDNYNITEQPEIYYETSIVAIKEDKTGTYTLDHILGIRNKDESIVKERYYSFVNMIDTYTEQELLKLINEEIDKLFCEV